MESIERKSSEESPTLAERKQRKAEFIRRLSENHVVVATSALPWCDFKAFPQYMLSTFLASEYVQGKHIGSVRPT